MTKVRIDTPGVTVEVESDDSLAEVSRRALKLFRKAGGWPQPGPVGQVGFSATDRRHTVDMGSSTMACPMEVPR